MPPKHNPNDVALLMEVRGECRKCKHRTSARLVAYYNGEVIVRCNHCKTAGMFDIFDEGYNDPKKFLPFIHNDDDTN